MLRKLLKHELHATGRYMWILYLGMVLVSVVGFLLTMVGNKLDMPETEAEAVIAGLSIVAVVLCFILLIVALFITVVLMVYRFYKNFLSDEGYLMFTLPVSVHQLIWSKLLVATLWQIIALMIAVLGIGLGLYGLSGSMFAEIEIGIQDSFALMGFKLDLNIPVMILEGIIYIIAGYAVGVLEFYCVMAVGFGFAKNKALWSVVLYFAIQTAISVISGVASIVSTIFAGDVVMESMMEISAMQQWHLNVLGGVGLNVVLGAVFYVVTVWNLKKRLNLS